MEEFHIEEAHRELVSTFRFTTYIEPLKRWPFTTDDGLTKRTKTHGNFPRLLLEQSATKGISRHKKVRDTPDILNDMMRYLYFELSMFPFQFEFDSLIYCR